MTTTTTHAQTHYDTWPEKMASMKRQAPDVGRGFGAMYQQLMGEGALTLREKELIALGIGMAIRCEPVAEETAPNTNAPAT